MSERPSGSVRLDSLANINPESLPASTPGGFSFFYIDISSVATGVISPPDARIERQDAPSRAQRVLRRNDVLMATVRPNLKAFAFFDLPGTNYVASTGFAVIRPKNGHDGRFILYSILSDTVGREVDSHSVGSNYPAINSSDVRRLSLPKFSPAEQRAIADVISALDAQIEATKALIAKQMLVSTGLMQDLFTRGIDENGQLRPPHEEAPHLYCRAELGWLPRGWKVEAFGKRIEVIDPNPTHRYPDEIEEGVPICSTENFIGTNGFDVSFAKHVSEATFIFQNNRCRYHPLDVIFARKGRIGLARRYGEDRKVFSHTVVTMKPLNSTVSPPWVLWLARSRAFLSGIAREMNSNSGVPTLGIEFLKSILVPFPPEPEQSNMATILDEASSAVTVLEDDLVKLSLQKSGLMQDLLTGKVSAAPLLESAAA